MIKSGGVAIRTCYAEPCYSQARNKHRPKTDTPCTKSFVLLLFLELNNVGNLQILQVPFFFGICFLPATSHSTVLSTPTCTSSRLLHSFHYPLKEASLNATASFYANKLYFFKISVIFSSRDDGQRGKRYSFWHSPIWQRAFFTGIGFTS